MRLEKELQIAENSKCENNEAFSVGSKEEPTIAEEGLPPKATKSKPSIKVVDTLKSQNRKVKTNLNMM